MSQSNRLISISGFHLYRRAFMIGLALLLALLASCRPPSPPPVPYAETINLAPETQDMIAKARRAVFLIPFSHWDTDWHDTFEAYSQRADHNILAAIQLAKQHRHFRYTLEQVLFVQHFWEAHPESRDDLIALVKNRQITFAWAGMTQPETSLAAPGVQWHNYLEGQRWIAENFGPEFIPTSAWQSDAFGNSAALPVFLDQAGVPNLYLGRFRRHCLPDDANCESLPPAFYWKSPLSFSTEGDVSRLLVTSIAYSTAWGTLINQTSLDDQITAFRAMVAEQFELTASKYLFLPYGFDFLDPTSALLDLVEQWNTSNHDTVLVISDPDTAYHYMATQDLPEITVDLNPLWQGFYGTRPYARIADKESEFYLTATDKFGLLLDPVHAGNWQTATVNAHYDNISAVGYDWVWEASQRPRFRETVVSSAEQLAAILAGITNRVLTESPNSPAMLFFNPLSWPNGGVIELHGSIPETALPIQLIDPGTAAVFIEQVPPIGYTPAGQQAADVPHPATVLQEPGLITLSNGLVSVRLDARYGGTFDRLNLLGEYPIELLSGTGDDLVYLEDTGDVYGARFGPELARQSQAQAEINVLAGGPLIARAQVAFSLGGQPITKTITLLADSPLIEVMLQMKTLPNTSALMRTSNSMQTDIRTDDLGFAAFEHPIDPAPIQAGDITYRRNLFYPITYWSDVSSGGYGLSLITHGLQGVGGTNELTLLLARSVSDPGDQAHEGVTDTELHTLHYAYYPHRGDAASSQPWVQAYAFNQPIIPVWQMGDQLNVQLPYRNEPVVLPFSPSSDGRLPEAQSLVAAEAGVIVDAYQDNGQTYSLIVNYDPSLPSTLITSFGPFKLPAARLQLVPVVLR